MLKILLQTKIQSLFVIYKHRSLKYTKNYKIFLALGILLNYYNVTFVCLLFYCFVTRTNPTTNEYHWVSVVLEISISKIHSTFKIHSHKMFNKNTKTGTHNKIINKMNDVGENQIVFEKSVE